MRICYQQTTWKMCTFSIIAVVPKHVHFLLPNSIFQCARKSDKALHGLEWCLTKTTENVWDQVEWSIHIASTFQLGSDDDISPLKCLMLAALRAFLSNTRKEKLSLRVLNKTLGLLSYWLFININSYVFKKIWNSIWNKICWHSF